MDEKSRERERCFGIVQSHLQDAPLDIRRVLTRISNEINSPELVEDPPGPQGSDPGKIADKIDQLAEDPDVSQDDSVVRVLRELANDVRRASNREP